MRRNLDWLEKEGAVKIIKKSAERKLGELENGNKIIRSMHINVWRLSHKQPTGIGGTIKSEIERMQK